MSYTLQYMKLLLGNNQSEKFVAFYDGLRQKSDVPFDYVGYESLLFMFDSSAIQPVSLMNLKHNRLITDYDGVYINNYVNTYELAAATAIVVEKLGIPYANHEFNNPLSLSKLTEYAKLAAGQIAIPRTLAGSKTALLHAETKSRLNAFPYVLKRADSDRGVDNYMVKDYEAIASLLEEHANRSIWILQEFVSNDGYYRVAYNGGVAQYAIFRSLQPRPDGNELKAHMFRPKGGENAELVDLDNLPSSVRVMSDDAVRVMNRQFAGVDCLYSAETGKGTIIEVNYNPQLVTIESFTDIRQAAFIEGLKRI